MGEKDISVLRIGLSQQTVRGWMEGVDDDDDRPHPQAVALSQTCWEYRSLLPQEKSQASQAHISNGGVSASAVSNASRVASPLQLSLQPSKIPSGGNDIVLRGDIGQDASDKPHADGEPRPAREPEFVDRASKRFKPRAAHSGQRPHQQLHQQRQRPRSDGGGSPTTDLQALRMAGNGHDRQDANRRSWDVFVLVLQASGLQQITSKAGFDVELSTLLVADPSLSFFRVTLWRKAARIGARLIRAGDLVRINRWVSTLAASSISRITSISCLVLARSAVVVIR